MFSKTEISDLEQVNPLVVVIELDHGYLSYSYASARYHLEDPISHHYFLQLQVSMTTDICLRIEGTPSKS